MIVPICQALTAHQRRTIMNQQFGKQASDQAEKLFKDALTAGNVQAFTEKGVVATRILRKDRHCRPGQR
jgi:hypothetical protein